MSGNELLDFINKFDSVTKKPEKYLSVQHKEADEIRYLTRDLYNFSKATEFPSKKTEALDKLIISNLDEEQIWQQLELQNNAVLNNFITSVAHILSKKNELNFPLKREKVQKSDYNETSTKLEKTSICDDGYSSEENIKKKSKEKKNKKENSPSKPIKSSIVDDKFFKLHEMEEYLDKMEQNHEYLKNDDDDDDDNESSNDDNHIDYFFDDSYTSDEDVENQPKYGDFFDQPEDEIEESNVKRKLDSNNEVSSKQKKVKFELDNKSNISSSDESLFDASLNKEETEIFDEHKEFIESENSNDVDDQVKDINQKKTSEMPPSTFEARQERLKLRINKLEENALKEKPWQMKGEITADSRPQNSLLEEYVEFDIATRPPPIITEKTTMRLEDIIKQRIKDKAWDDVVRKIKPTDLEMEYKKKLVLDQEKSKLSLAEIYEQEYLKQAENKVDKTIIDKPEIDPPAHQEIKGLLKNLFRKLDALSNFHFTPHPVSAEIKIINNLPAITMEEVTPMATSNAALLAPEEVKAKQKGELIGKSERTVTDKKRERRRKKLKQKLKYKNIEKNIKEKLDRTNDDSKSIHARNLSNNLLRKITKSSNVTSLKDNGSKYLKSSSAFFSKLQDSTKKNISKNNKFSKKTINQKSKLKKK